MKAIGKRTRRPRPLYARVREILTAARSRISRTVDSTQVAANWLVGREIVEEEQQGQRRAGYGARLLEDLSRKLQRDFGAGYSAQNLRYMRQFYVEFPALIQGLPIRHTPCGELPSATALPAADEICHTVCGESGEWSHDWRPGQLHPNISWSLYRQLLRVDKPAARSFYEIEAAKESWSARELERQINSLLYERLAMSRDKKGLLRLARKGQEIHGPLDVFKEPLILEFLNIPATAKLVESDLEQALLNELQSFLLELGKGFAFVERQERITLNGDHFYIDLVFYHTVLKCYVLVDLKVRKLTHEDLGQFQLYLNYYDRERCTPGDHPTLGLILCTDKNDAVVRYTLGEEQQKKIFAGRYKLHLPTEAELKTELLRELKNLTPTAAPRPRRAKRKTKP